MSMYRRSTKKSIVPNAPTNKINVQYPREVLRTAPGEKPKISLKLMSDNLQTVRGILKKSIINNNIQLDVCITFLYLYFKTVDEELLEDWKSYDIVIKEKNNRVSPIDLINFSVTTVNREGTESTNATEADDAWMAIYVTGIYRLIRAKVPEYKSLIANKITEQIKSVHQRGQDASEVTDLYLGWQNDRGYNALIGVIDMFFNKFPTHPSANIRISTTGSRYKDCAALMSYGYIINLLGLETLNELLDWVFISKIGDELDNMMKEDEELTDPYSYFPYQMDLGIVVKSAFSAVANPHFYEFVHIAGALVRSTRSRNARHISDSQVLNILLNSSCMAYAYSHVFRLQKVYVKNLDDFRDEDLDDAGDAESLADGTDTLSTAIRETLKSTDPYAWIKMLKATDYVMPADVRAYIKKVASTITDPRQGTIDEHLRSIADSL